MKIFSITLPWWLLELPLLAGILAVAIFLRFTDLQTAPGWYTDEATHLDIARHLKAGEIQYMAVQESLLFFGRVPLFHIVLAGLLSIQDEGLYSVRLLTASLGTISVVLMWWVLRRLAPQPRIFPLVAALMYAMYPQAVLYNRYGFSYNLLVPLVLLVLWGLGEYLRSAERKWLFMAAFAIGLGFVTDLAMFTFVVPLLIVIVLRRWHDALWSLPLVALPFMLFATAMLIHAGSDFVFDVRYTLQRLQGPPLWQQPQQIADSYIVLIAQDVWMVAGIIGLFLIRPLRLAKLCALLMLFPILNSGRIVPLFSLSYYYLIPILPFVAIGVAGLVCVAVPFLWRFLTESMAQTLAGLSWPAHPESLVRLKRTFVYATSAFIIGILVISPFWKIYDYTLNLLDTGWPNPISTFLINPRDARRVADYLEPRLDSADVVIVSPPVGVLLKTKVVDFTMAPAIVSSNTVRFWGDVEMPRRRFHHDPRYSEARFAVVDNLWYNFGVYHAEGVRAMMEDVQSNWILLFQAGGMAVYQNPRFD